MPNNTAQKIARNRKRAEKRRQEKANGTYKPRTKKKAKHGDKTDAQLRAHLESLTWEKSGKRKCSDKFIDRVIATRNKSQTKKLTDAMGMV